jgi:catechol 2,3-dioxygenase-like lactoylglutathione lyase family enzyme
MAIEIEFVAGFGPIVRDPSASRELYQRRLGVAFQEEAGGYLHTEMLDGVRTFALWPLVQAARSCFGRDSWPDDIPAPQAWLELEVADVAAATAALEARGSRFLLKNRREPWGQTVSRFLSPEGLLVGVRFTPALRDRR